MPGAKKTPSIYLKGRFTFITPFVTEPAFQYTCIAIRSFQDIVEDGEDVYATYYLPLGISESDYSVDSGLKANIITLLRSDNTFLYIPDTYIESYPNMDGVEYKHVVLGISLGPIPDFVDLTLLKDRLSAEVSDVIGVTGTVVESIAPHAGSITPAQHEALETARVAAIIQRETLFSQHYLVKAQLEDALLKISALQQILIDNDLLN